MADETIKQTVREKYGEAALRVVAGQTNSCCGAGAAGSGSCDPITTGLYTATETAGLPEKAVLASLGCGNPTALAELHEGETVLDLGSGGGIDVLLSARRVGPLGKAYGLDMTQEMLALARENQRKAGVANVEFLKGEIERIPLPDASVDVIISNCVINLSADKRQVLREAFRVLRPGGRFAVSDVVVEGQVPQEVRRSMELWVGCIAGALEVEEFKALLRETGFEAVDIEPTRVYRVEDARAFLTGSGLNSEILATELDGRFMGAFVRARKPWDGAIRPARPAELAEVLSLLRDAGLPTEGVGASFEHFLVAERDGRILGTIGLEAYGRLGLLRSAAVRDHLRGSGLGSALTMRLLQASTERGIEELSLLTETAEGFFPRFGFVRATRDVVPRIVKQSVEFRESCPATATVMVRR
jgi:arsenite methyltransferase